jgi:hypothetical protein
MVRLPVHQGIPAVATRRPDPERATPVRYLRAPGGRIVGIARPITELPPPPRVPEPPPEPLPEPLPVPEPEREPVPLPGGRKREPPPEVTRRRPG